MKIYTFFCLLAWSISFSAFAQTQTQNGSVGIGTSIPNPNAILDISSDSKGLLIPRLNKDQQKKLTDILKTSVTNSDPDPNGLLIYNTEKDSLQVWVKKLKQWVNVGAGQKGDKGDNGLDGKAGSVWYSDDKDITDPIFAGTLNAKDGDYYLNSKSGDVYKKTTDPQGKPDWIKVANLIVGTPGKDGKNGPTWYSGSDTPTVNPTTPASATDNDFYICTGNNYIYQIKGNSWKEVVKIKGDDGQNGQNGAAGATGTTWYSGDEVPAAPNDPPEATESRPGDYYFSISDNWIYKKTPTNNWAKVALIKGQEGPRGLDGGELSWLKKGNGKGDGSVSPTTTNPGTETGKHFVGTTDDKDLVLASNRHEGIRIQPDGRVRIGIYGGYITSVYKTSRKIDLPIVAAGQPHIETFTINVGATSTTNTVPKTKVNSAVFISPEDPLPDGLIIAYARIQTTDVVEIKFINVSPNDTSAKTITFHIAAIE